MATAVHDLASTTWVRASLEPLMADSAVNGAGVDLISADGSAFAIVSIGSLSDGAEVTITVQESSDGVNWTAVSGVEFDPITTEGTIAVRTFRRSQRYVRLTLGLTGTAPEVFVAGLIGQQLKTV